MRPALRYVAVASSLLAASACARMAEPVSPLAMADPTETAFAPPPAAHHGFNPFFHHASLTRPAPSRTLSSSSPIADLCADAQAKAVLDRDLPGLTTRPEFDFFKHMNLKTLKAMSRGKMTDEDVARVDADLAKLPPSSQTVAFAP